MKRTRRDPKYTSIARLRPLSAFGIGGILLCLAFLAWLVWPRSHSIEIQTDPSGAEVSVDGNRIGTSPVEITLRSQNALIDASLDGYQTATLEYQRGDSNKPLHLSLQPKPATCSINLLPGNAEVAVRESHAVITENEIRTRTNI